MMVPIGPRAYAPIALQLDPAQVAPLSGWKPLSPWEREAAGLLGEARIETARAILPAKSEPLRQYEHRARDGAAARALFQGLPRQNPFTDEHIGPGLHVALQAIRGNHARFINVGSRFLWFDSHTDNFHIQQDRLAPALADIARFLDALKAERNAHGPLIEQTTVLIGSELGRYPKLNGVRGKDHWPENSWILAGRGLRREPGGVTIGATDARYRGVPIDFRSGATSGADRRPITIDALFATIIKLAGGDPGRYEYGGDATLDCLCA
jgi:hypothetical protein